jgi:hypothetical protein
LAVGLDGTVHIAWSDLTDYGGSGGDQDIFYKRYMPSSGWTVTEVVSTESTYRSIDPSLAVGLDGTVHIAWSDEIHYHEFAFDDIFYRSYIPGNGWTITDVVSTESTYRSIDPSLAVGLDGTVHIAWSDETAYSPMEGNFEIFYRSYVPGNGWTIIQVVSPEGWASWDLSPSLAVGPDGTVHIAWYEDTDFGNFGGEYTFYRSYVPGNGWTITEVVSPESTYHSRFPSLAVGLDGTVHIAWWDLTDYGGSGGDWDIFYKKKVTWEYTFGAIDKVDIGNSRSERGHPMWGWGPIHHWKGNWRVTWNPKEGTSKWDRGAVVNLRRSKGSIIKCLSLRVLDGPKQSFDVYAKVSWGKSWTDYKKLYRYDGTWEVEWVTHKIRLPAHWRYATKIRVRIVATGKSWRWFETYGQLAVDWVKLTGYIKVYK